MEDGTRVMAREHRVVTKAPPGSHVHHINGVKDDNRPENLVVYTPTEHFGQHDGAGRRLPDMSCAICGRSFRPRSATSRTCREAECVAEHHRRAARKANQERWAGKSIMTPEERTEAAREYRRRWREKNRGG